MSELVSLCIKILEDKKAQDVVVLDMRELFPLCEFFVIATYTAPSHRDAIVDSLLEGIKKFSGKTPKVEGTDKRRLVGRWILVEAGDVMIHLFDEEARKFYDIEGLWFEAKRL